MAGDAAFLGCHDYLPDICERSSNADVYPVGKTINAIESERDVFYAFKCSQLPRLRLSIFFRFRQHRLGAGLLTTHLTRL